MKAVLPGKPESRLQALATGYWDSRRVTVRLLAPHPVLTSFTRPTVPTLANSPILFPTN